MSVKQRDAICAFCGLRQRIMMANHKELAIAHIKVCPEHPIRQVEAEVKRLRAELAERDRVAE